MKIALLAALAFWAAAVARADGLCGPVFVIERSLNANVVLYDAVRQPDGTLDPQRPLAVTWRMDAQDGRREGLNFVERIRAFGVDVAPLAERDAWRVRIRALPARPLVLRGGAGCPLVVGEIAGREADLRRVYVAATGGILPRVSFVALSGFSLETSQPVTECFVP